MTSPSETPLDLDEALIQAAYMLISAEKLLTVQPAKAWGTTTRALIPPHWREAAIERAHPYISAAHEVAEARPRTVGDLTARDLGRRVRIDGREMIIDSIMSARDHGVLLGLWPARLTVESLDTPVEFLDDEPASGHQQPGERFPSHETSEGAQVDPDADERGNASAFRSSKEES